MKIDINRELLPIKAHYFFFMAALGPILPQINVFGRQLGISPALMGILLSVLPILYFLAKPLIGVLADHFSKFRKIIFISIVIIMTVSFGCYLFLPSTSSKVYLNYGTDILSCDDLKALNTEKCLIFHSVDCLTTNSSNYKLVRIDNVQMPCSEMNLTHNDNKINSMIECRMTEDVEAPNCFYNSWVFWVFVFLTYMGTIGFNVGNSISDAICFDVLGEKQMKYGKQRVFGTIGFGLTSLISGYAVDMNTNDFTPAIVIMLFFASIDLFCIKKLKLPKLSASESIFKDVTKLVKQRKIYIFLIFATLAGILDAFIIYYMFWYLEEIAEQTGMKERIKLIEGLTVAAECLGGEILFFIISGKILKKIGYIHCFTFCFFAYSVRLFLISLITNPWYLIPVELFMQGCTYALCYTCIVGYAATVSPSGTSATVQGLVAGMDDGLGFSIGALLGGILYQEIGGRRSFQMFALLALITCIAHMILRPSSHEMRVKILETNGDQKINDMKEVKPLTN